MVKKWDWLKSKLRDLTRMEQVGELSKFGEVFYEARAWTPLKLIFLMYYVDVYTRIISRYFKNMVYLDLLAGPGVDYIKETGDYILGSPLVAPIFARKPFNKLIYAERVPERIGELYRRTNFIPHEGKYVFVEGDINDKIREVLEHLEEEDSHYLAFVDCEGLDVSWQTMKSLLQLPGDVIFVHQTAEINRVRGRAAWSVKDAERLTWFYGSNRWCLENLLGLYEAGLRTWRDITIPITVKGRGFHYDLIFATRRTKSGSPWLKAVYYAKERIEKFTGEAVKIALDVLTGRSTEIDWFFKEEST